MQRRHVPLLVKLGSLGATDAEVADTVRFLASCGVDGMIIFSPGTFEYSDSTHQEWVEPS